MLVAKIIGYYILLIFIYSTIILEFFGFQVMSPEPVNHPHWLIEWGIFIAVAITMTASLVFIIKRFIAVIIKFYKKLPIIVCSSQKQTKNMQKSKYSN